MPARPKRINFWSSPRNVSTALLYAFAQRPDTTVVDEPLYAAYLHRFPELAHPGREEILASQAQSPGEVVANVLFGSYPTELVLFKQMTHHLQGIDFSFTARMGNVLLIRDPRAIIASYGKVISTPDMQDIGIRLQERLWKYLKQEGALQAVLDTDELLKAPEEVLVALCERLGIAFDPDMLHWPVGGRPEDGVWAPYWYSGVHQSSGFLPYSEKEYELTPQQEELARDCMPVYAQLRAEALVA